MFARIEKAGNSSFAQFNLDAVFNVSERVSTLMTDSVAMLVQSHRRAHQKRRERAEFYQMSDHVLSDIGVSKIDTMLD